jgi:hypothetical protein
MATTSDVPSDATADRIEAALDARADRLDRLERELRSLEAILDDPIQLIDRLRELELQRRAPVHDFGRDSKGSKARKAADSPTPRVDISRLDPNNRYDRSVLNRLEREATGRRT